MGYHLWVGKPPRYVTILTQAPTLSGTGIEYWPTCGDALQLGVKAGWLFLFVDKRV